jgi:hypothetical protein
MNEPSNEYNETKSNTIKPKLRALVEALAKFAQTK